MPIGGSGRLYQVMGEKEQANAELAKVNQLHKVQDEGLVRQMTGSPLAAQPHSRSCFKHIAGPQRQKPRRS